MKIKNIEIRKIHSHPDNPRKDLGDITELSQSIAENGIMQNLTVVEIEDGEYTAIIGHRRLAAALKAGLDTVPCAVVKMDEKEQQSTMLCENMQRSDLTVYEQAQGFQMMLDLGSTEDEIAEKTGFSKQTVKHRINLAKLDQKLLKEKNADENFQMTLKDMYELERVDDIDKRNEILSNANDSLNLKYLINNYLRRKERIVINKKIIELLKELIPEIEIINAKEGSNYQWESAIFVETRNATDEEMRKIVETKINKIDQSKCEEIVAYEQYDQIYIKSKKVEQEKTAEETRKDELRKKRENIINELKDCSEAVVSKSSDFIEDIILGKYELNLKEIGITEEIYISKMWKMLTMYDPDISEDNLATNLEDIYDYRNMEIPEDDEFFYEKVGNMPVIQQMWLAISDCTLQMAMYDSWSGKYRERRAEKYLYVCDMLTAYGFSLDEDEKNIVKGNCNLTEELKQIDEELNG